jgi:Cys-rich protein (TIGR01571 family)
MRNQICGMQSTYPEGKWTTSCTDCCDDCEVCFITWLSLPVAHGIVMDKLNGGGCCEPCFMYYLGSLCCSLSACVCGPKRRSGVRNKYGLPEEPCGGAPFFLAHDLLPKRLNSAAGSRKPAHRVVLFYFRLSVTGQLSVCMQ